MGFFKLHPNFARSWPESFDGMYGRVWASYRELDRTQWLTPEEIVEGQLRQARTLLEHCMAEVPHYRQTLCEAGISPAKVQTLDDLRKIPLLSRRTYQENQARMQAEHLPPGVFATSTPQTSGSSGTPTTVYQTSTSGMWWHAFYLRDFEWCGIDPTGVGAAIRSRGRRGEKLADPREGVTSRSWIGALQDLVQSGRGHLLNISVDHASQLEWLQKVKPNYILSYPANLEVLATMLAGRDPWPELRAIQTISDTLTDDQRATIEAAFRVPVKNTYSCMEAGYLASPCPAGHGFHVHAENVILEVLDDNGAPCAEGETGRVVLTALHNFRGPFVRYDIGDLATVGPCRCACGRGLPLLTRVQGKNGIMFHLTGGRRKDSVALARHLRMIGGHWQHQVAQKATDHVVLRLVKNPDWTDKHTDRFQEKLREFFETPIRVDIELHAHLPPPPSGKFQNMVLEMT